MRHLRVVVLAILVGALVATAAPAVAATSSSAGARADGSTTATTAAKRKRCRKGYVRKRVRGKVRCVKRKRRAGSQQTPAPGPGPTGAPAPGPTPPPGPGPAPGPTTVDGKDQFNQLITGARLYRVYANTTSTGSTQGNDAYSFCPGGVLNYYGEYIGHVSSSTTRWSGTWSVERAAATADGAVVEALVNYTTNSSEVPPGQVIVRVYRDSQQAFIGNSEGSTEYQRQPGQGNC